MDDLCEQSAQGIRLVEPEIVISSVRVFCGVVGVLDSLHIVREYNQKVCK